MTDGVSAVYSGASDFGKFTATIGGIIGTLIGIIIIGIGIYLVIEGLKRTSQTKGDITKSKCTSKASTSALTEPTFSSSELIGC